MFEYFMKLKFRTKLNILFFPNTLSKTVESTIFVWLLEKWLLNNWNQNVKMGQNENKNVFVSFQPLLFPKTKEGENLHSYQTITRQSSKSTIKKQKAQPSITKSSKLFDAISSTACGTTHPPVVIYSFRRMFSTGYK